MSALEKGSLKRLQEGGPLSLLHKFAYIFEKDDETEEIGEAGRRGMREDIRHASE